MPPRKKQRVSQTTVHISPPELTQLEFKLGEAAGGISSWRELQFELGLRLARLAIDRLGVELEIELKNTAAIACKAAYRATYTLDLSHPNDDRAIERELRNVVMQLGPTTLFPFLRETIATTVAKAGLPPLILPLINLRTMFEEAQIEIPAPPVDSDSKEGGE